MQAPCYFGNYLDGINRGVGVRADFIERIPGVAVDTDRVATLERLRPAHEERVQGLGFDWAQLQGAEQVHGSEIAMVGKHPVQVWPGVDGLLTAEAGVVLGIYVADCGAVYLSDERKGVLGLLHSGKKGTEGNITGRAIRMMQDHYGSQPEDIEVALAPCIRPPRYEIDFASQIRRQVLDAGVPEARFTDSGICTGADLDRYYSYRMERGSTGRMLALLGRCEGGGELLE